jgi:putative transposase
VFPYLLRHRLITQPNEVWAMDSTYIPMPHSFVYLAAVMDWASRRLLSWRVSITLDSTFCVAALEEAIARYGCPTIMNTDQGSQFTSAAFTGALLDRGIRISMDGRGCWRDNSSTHLRRTALALAQVRRGVPARLRLRVRREGRHRTLRHAL